MYRLDYLLVCLKADSRGCRLIHPLSKSWYFFQKTPTLTLADKSGPLEASKAASGPLDCSPLSLSLLAHVLFQHPSYNITTDPVRLPLIAVTSDHATVADKHMHTVLVNMLASTQRSLSTSSSEGHGRCAQPTDNGIVHIARSLLTWQIRLRTWATCATRSTAEDEV